MNEHIFKAYDIRGIYPTDIHEDVVTNIGKVLARMFPVGEFVIAYDARHGSPELAMALEKSIQASNPDLTVRAIGFSSTPMFYFIVNHFNAVGGAMITASHNPKEYNGIKIVKAKAEMISGQEILETMKTYGLR